MGLPCVSSISFTAAVAGIRESKLLWCLIYLCSFCFTEILVFFFLVSQRVAGLMFAAVSKQVKTPSGMRWRMSPRMEMRRFYLSNFHMSGVNSQSAKTNRSCQCLIIQTWCIYSSSTKESRPPCIMNHQVFGTVSRLDEVWTAWHRLNKFLFEFFTHLWKDSPQTSTSNWRSENFSCSRSRLSLIPRMSDSHILGW